MAYESAFAKTPVDEYTILKLPAARWLVSKGDGEYFDSSSKMFRKLFSYIKENDVSMTVPVEGRLDETEMRFYLGSETPEGLLDTDTVKIVSAPSRTVASLGASGSYTKKNVESAIRKLKIWVDRQENMQSVGEPYVVFWDGPFKLWFLKHFEVHLPVTEQ
jgi:DNA gyrase inhibitor GyrI